MKRRRKIQLWLLLLGVPLIAVVAYFATPVRTEVAMPIASVRAALKQLYPQYNFKTVTTNGMSFGGDMRKAKEHPA